MCFCFEQLRGKMKKTEINKKEYPAEAYTFIQELVNFAISRAGELRHVSGAELLENCRLYAAQQFGFMAQNVLENWNINSGDDIGNLVYELIETGKLSASPGDSREDFSIKFNLFENNNFRIKYEAEITEPLITD